MGDEEGEARGKRQLDFGTMSCLLSQLCDRCQQYECRIWESLESSSNRLDAVCLALSITNWLVKWQNGKFIEQRVRSLHGAVLNKNCFIPCHRPSLTQL